MKNKYALKTIKFLLKILPTLFWLVLIFAFDKPYIAALTLLSALIHELGHIAALIKFSPGYRFFGVASGFRLSAEGTLSYKEEMITALSGPLMNVIAFLGALPFMLSPLHHYAKVLGAVNLFTAISNLVPIRGYDGYRILECLINQYAKFEIPASLLRAFSFLLSSLICLFSLYLIRSFDGGYWIFFIFLAALIRAIAADTSHFSKKAE